MKNVKLDPSTGDAILDEEGNAVFEESPSSMAEGLFPRRAQAFKENAGAIRKGAATLSDLGSNLLGVPYAGVEALTEGKPFREALANRKGGSIGKRIANDPSTVIGALLTGGGNTIRQLTMAGLKQGAVSAAGHQVENVGEGREVSPRNAALETAVGGILPAGAKKAGQVGKAAGKGFMQSILKPSKFLRETEKIDIGDLIELLGSKRPFKGSLSGMAKSAEEMESGLTQKYGNIVSDNAKTKVNVRGALATTRKGFEKGFSQEKKHGDVIEGLDKGAEYWKKITDRQGTNAGWVDLPKEVNLRQSVGRAGRYNANKDPRELEGSAQFARELYNNLTEQESRLVPELAPVKKQLSKLYPLQEAVENARGRTANNFYPGLTDNIALSSAAQASRPEMTIPGLLLFMANRMVKNPAAATATYQAGKGLERPGAKQQAVREAIKRALGQSFRDEE